MTQICATQGFGWLRRFCLLGAVTRAAHAGTVPAAWATPGSMTRLAALHLGGNALTGSLPPEWGIQPASLPRLTVLGLARNKLTGTLPDVWGTGFPVRPVLLRSADGRRAATLVWRDCAIGWLCTQSTTY